MQRKADSPLFAYLLIAFFALCVWLPTLAGSQLFQTNGYSSIAAMVDGTADKPFIYRTMVPSLTRTLLYITPEPIAQAVGQALLHSSFWENTLKLKPDSMSPQLSDPAMMYACGWILLLMYVFLVAYGITLYLLAKECFPAYALSHLPLSTALLGLFFLLPFIDRDTKLYDFPTLALSAACLLTLFKQRWRAYIYAFILFCLNKETAIIQTVYFMTAGCKKMPWRQWAGFVLLQCVLFAAITVSIHYAFAHNPGEEMYHGDVLHKEIAGFSIYEAGAILLFAGMLFARWRSLPQALRHYLGLLPVFIGLYLKFGRYAEYRIFFDIFPGLTLIAGYTLFAWKKEDDKEVV